MKIKSTRVCTRNSKLKLVSRKRSQEEMVGFVLIIILVSVIALVFLAISVRKPAETLKSSEIESFLYSSMYYTTNCYRSQEFQYRMEDLIEACYKEETCLNGNFSCDILKGEINNMLKESFKVGQEEKYKAYMLNIQINNETFFSSFEGNFTGNKQGAWIPINTGFEKVDVELEFSY